MIVRWVCEKCNKKWIYPIEKCVYCKGDVKKQKGTQLKVIGITKVTIPSPMHPIVPYNIILLQDEHGNRLPKKTMRDYKIGDIYTEQKAKTQDAVSIVKVKYDIYEAIKQAIELLNLEFKPEDKILIKPSCVTAAYPYQVVNTNPDFLNALLLILFEKQIKKEDIMVVEQALIGSDAVDAASKSGIMEVCKKHNVLFVDASKGPFEEVEIDGYKFNIFKEALNRKVINAPIMKTNFQLGISGAVENLSRLTDEKAQRSMYVDGIENTFSKLMKAVPNISTLADATNGMQGQGPLTLGEPAFLNLVLASRNAAKLDAAFCEAAMIEVPDYIKNLNDSKNIEIVGNELDALKYPLKQPVPFETPHPDIRVIDGKSCPACLNLMYSLSSKLIGLRGDEIKIIMGYHINEDIIKSNDRIIALGDCVARRLEELGLNIPRLGEQMDSIEQLLLLKKLLTTKGTPKITPIDRVKTKMKMLLSRVVR